MKLHWLYDWANDMATIILLLMAVVVFGIVMVVTGHAALGTQLSGPLSLLALAVGFFVDNRRSNRRRRRRIK